MRSTMLIVVGMVIAMVIGVGSMRWIIAPVGMRLVGIGMRRKVARMRSGPGIRVCIGKERATVLNERVD